MSTPESTPTTTPDLAADERVKQDDLTRSVGKRLDTQSSSGTAPWWKRLLGRG